MRPSMIVSAARMHGHSPGLLFGWKRRLDERGQVVA
ncbi:hypothetical protein [Methylobacterium longum]